MKMNGAQILCATAVLAMTAPAHSGPTHIVDTCFTVHGRLSFGNGTPPFRIWKIGTGRSLGVFDCDGNPEGDRVLPTRVQKMMGKNFSEVFADFEVCPLSKERTGERQRVCIRNARNLVLGRPTP